MSKKARSTIAVKSTRGERDFLRAVLLDVGVLVISMEMKSVFVGINGLVYYFRCGRGLDSIKDSKTL